MNDYIRDKYVRISESTHQQLVELAEEQCRTLKAQLEFMVRQEVRALRLQQPDLLVQAKSKKKNRQPKARAVSDQVLACFAHYLAKRQSFMVRSEGFEPGKVPNPPRLTDRYVAAIEAAIKRHDSHLAGASLEQFVGESRAWAAAGGLFCSPHHTATSKENDAGHNGKRYLEPWRPWELQRGKPDPVDGFAEDYRRVELAEKEKSFGRFFQWAEEWKVQFAKLKDENGGV